MEKVPTTRYVVVRFVPDPVRDERINIGIVAVQEDGETGAKFLADLKKVRRFSPESSSVAKECIAHMNEWLLNPNPELGRQTVDESTLSQFATEYRNLIQFSHPMTALLPLEQLLEMEFTRMVDADEPTEVAHRPSTVVYNSASSSLLQGLERRFRHPEVARGLVHRNIDLTGALSTHRMGLAVQNGQPYLAAQVVSLRNGPTEVERAVGSVAWDIRDISDASDRVRLSVLFTEPSADRRVVAIEADASALFRELGAEIVRPPEIGAWAEDVVAAIPDTAVN